MASSSARTSSPDSSRASRRAALGCGLSLGSPSGPSLCRLVAAQFRDDHERVLVINPDGTLLGRNIVSSCSWSGSFHSS